MQGEDFKILNMNLLEFGKYAYQQGEEWRKNNPELMDTYHAVLEGHIDAEISDIEKVVDRALDKHTGR